MTREELIAKCKAENPKMFQTINDETFELVGEDYEKACSDWADYQLEKLELEAKQAQAQAKRSAALAKLEALGLDEDDLKALGL